MKGVFGKPYICMDEYVNAKLLKDIVPDINYGLAKANSFKRLNYGIENHDEHWTAGSIGSDIKHAYNYWKEKETDSRLLEYGESLYKTNMVEFHTWLVYQYDVFEMLHYMVLREFDRDINETYFPYDNEIENPYKCKWTDESKHFPSLQRWAEQLPFEKLGPVVILLKNANMQTVRHNDKFKHNRIYDHEEHFIWCDPRGSNKLWIEDENQNKISMEPGSCFYWNNHDYHGGWNPTYRVDYSIRIEGVFTKELRDRLNNIS